MVQHAADIFGHDVGAQRPARVEIAEHRREIRDVREHARLIIIMVMPIDGRAIDAHRTLAGDRKIPVRSEEHTSELQSLMRISYASLCLKKKYDVYTMYSIINTSHQKHTAPPAEHIRQINE